MGSGDILFTVVAKNIDVLAMPLVSLVYPLYCSVKAIETKSRIDGQQWLTCWVLYSLITLFELTFSKLIECKPDDVLSTAEKYIQENGPEAFERLIARADREARSSYSIFRDDYEY
ncbi:hypothetical protein SASPL_110505 [Salvia splendens]|uniref:HVA22-like protein n=1 Tax=Salvia splendens TaxID=180675 RepID=A0A8X9A499_SALSN|nr:hypothetical protein SASPL_110505 [Salvia splendens]